MHASVHSGHEPMVAWLLGHGADPNAAMTRTGWTPMHAAAKQNLPLIYDLLKYNGGRDDVLATCRGLGAVTPETLRAEGRRASAAKEEPVSANYRLLCY